jgi:hypothetical protein
VCEGMNLFIYLFIFFFVMEHQLKKKNDGKLHHCAWCMMQSFRHFFFPVIAASPKKTNKFILYHLIISKHIYYNKTIYFMICFCTIFCDAWLFCDGWAFTSQIDFFGRHKIISIFQPIEKHVTWIIKWYRN